MLVCDSCGRRDKHLQAGVVRSIEFVMRKAFGADLKEAVFDATMDLCERCLADAEESFKKLIKEQDSFEKLGKEQRDGQGT